MPTGTVLIRQGDVKIKFFSGRDAGEFSDARCDEFTGGAAAAIRKFIAQKGDEPIDDLGIPNRIHYMVIALFAFLVALVPLLFALTPGGGEIRQPTVYAVCGIGIAIAPVYVYLGWRWRFQFREWIFQAVLFYSIAGPMACQFVLDELRPAILTLYMLGPIGAAFYFPLKRALPLMVYGGVAIVGTSAFIDEPDAMMRGAIVAVVTLSCALMLSAMKRHLVRTVQSNRELSERDALTGAYNLHKFDERLTAEIVRSRRESGSGFALIEFDLDQFKPVNDTYNHSVGDNVLVVTAEAIQSVLAPADLLVRRGGDEFAVIAPYSSERDIPAMIELARDRIARARRELCPDLLPTVSTGWVTHDHREPAETLLRRADDALHNAKRAARERDALSGARRSHAIAPAPRIAPTAGELIELRRHGLDSVAIGDDPISGAMQIAWRTATLATLLLSAVLAVMGLNGLTSFEFSTPVIALLITWVFVMSPIAIWASTRSNQSVGMAHMLSVSALALNALGCVAIGDAAPVAVEMFLLSNVVFMALLPVRPATCYAAIGFGLYGYFLYSSNYPVADVRFATTVVNFAIVGMLLAINRQRTLEAASEKAQLARTDALTGLPNMRMLRDRLTYEIRRCEATGESCALLMLDLDEFKAVNDDHSHTTGDKVLVAVADALEKTARHADMPARRGGDEFVVVLTDAGECEAEAAARRVGDAIRRARLRIITDINPNASVGWVVWQPGDSVDELIHRADSALKSVKSASRRDRHAVGEFA